MGLLRRSTPNLVFLLIVVQCNSVLADDLNDTSLFFSRAETISLCFGSFDWFFSFPDCVVLTSVIVHGRVKKKNSNNDNNNMSI